MAIEWTVPVGIALTKLLLRACDSSDVADQIGDVQEGWLRLRQFSASQDRVGIVISKRLEQRLAGVEDRAKAQDLTATAHDVAGLLDRFANDSNAVRAAATHPEQFLAFAMRHGGDDLRRLTPLHSTPVFDQILNAAAAEFARLAPSSRQFAAAALTEILRLSELIPDISKQVQATRQGVEQLVKANEIDAAVQSRVTRERVGRLRDELDQRYGLAREVIYSRKPIRAISSRVQTNYRAQVARLPRLQNLTLSDLLRAQSERAEWRVAAWDDLSTYGPHPDDFWLVEIRVHISRCRLDNKPQALKAIGSNELERTRAIVGNGTGLVDQILADRDRVLSVPKRVHVWMAQGYAPWLSGLRPSDTKFPSELAAWIEELRAVASLAGGLAKLLDALGPPAPLEATPPAVSIVYPPPDDLDEENLVESPLGPDWISLTPGKFLPILQPIDPLEDAHGELKAGRRIQARDLAQEQLHNGNVGALVFLGTMDFEDGDVDSAMTYWLESWIYREPVAAFNMGTTYRQLGDEDRGLTWLTRAAEVGHSESIAALAEQRAANGNFQEEEAWLNKLQMPEEAVYVYDAGVRAVNRGDSELAISRWGRALQMSQTFRLDASRRLRVNHNISQFEVTKAALWSLGKINCSRNTDAAKRWLDLAVAAGEYRAQFQLALLIRDRDLRRRELEKLLASEDVEFAESISRYLSSME